MNKKNLACLSPLFFLLAPVFASELPTMTNPMANTVEIDTSDLVKQIKQEKADEEKSQQQLASIKPPASLAGDDVTGQLDFNLGVIDQELNQSDKNSDLYLQGVPVPKTSMIFSKDHHYTVTNSLLDAPKMLPSNGGYYDYRVLGANQAQLTLVPDHIHEFKGEVYKIVLTFKQNSAGDFKSEMYQNLGHKVPIPVDFNQLIYVTDQDGQFKLSHLNH